MALDELKTYKGADPDTFQTGKDLSFKSEQLPERRMGTVGYTRGIENEVLPIETPISPKPPTQETSRAEPTSYQILPPVSPVSMTRGEYDSKMNEIDMEAKLAAPVPQQLRPVNLVADVIMFTLDAWTGKPKWTNFRLNTRRDAEQRMESKYAADLEEYKQKQPLLEQQAKSKKLQLTRQYLEGQKEWSVYEKNVGDFRNELFNNIEKANRNLEELNKSDAEMRDKLKQIGGDNPDLSASYNAQLNANTIERNRLKVSRAAMQNAFYQTQGSSPEIQTIQRETGGGAKQSPARKLPR